MLPELLALDLWAFIHTLNIVCFALPTPTIILVIFNELGLVVYFLIVALLWFVFVAYGYWKIKKIYLIIMHVLSQFVHTCSTTRMSMRTIIAPPPTAYAMLHDILNNLLAVSCFASCFK